MPESFHLEQQKHHPVPRIDPLHRILQCYPQADLGFRRGVILTRRLRLPLPFPAQVVAHVDDDPAEPGPDAGIALEAADRFVDFDEGLLDRILRVLAVADDVKRDALQAGAVELVKLFECTDIPPAACRQQLLLGGVLHRWFSAIDRQ
jgi:hypothetical protein